jgi:hypothetical protein
MDRGIDHVICGVDSGFAVNNCSFQMASNALFIGRASIVGIDDVVGCFLKFRNNRTYAVVIADQVRSMLRCGYVMACNAGTSGWNQGSVDAAEAAGGVAMGTVVDNKATFSRLKERSKVAAGGRCKSGCGMASNAPVSR